MHNINHNRKLFESALNEVHQRDKHIQEVKTFVESNVQSDNPVVLNEIIGSLLIGGAALAAGAAPVIGHIMKTRAERQKREAEIAETQRQEAVRAKEAEAARSHTTSERQAGETFKSGESAAERGFREGESAKQRGHETKERRKQRKHASSEATRTRQHATREGQKGRRFKQSERKKSEAAALERVREQEKLRLARDIAKAGGAIVPPSPPSRKRKSKP